MNDGEAHALAMLRTSGVKFGAVSVSLGTGVGIGVIGADRRICRPCSGENWDVGDFQLTTRASDKSVWWALGSNGLRELESNMGSEAAAMHFGSRLGAFFVQLCTVFPPRTIVVSGGIANRKWKLMRSTVAGEMTRIPSHFDHPKLIPSPFEEAALVGAAQALAYLC
jgi:predicted NBD/HSP70 family sugar kinase